jgi:hypothetical protein
MERGETIIDCIVAMLTESRAAPHDLPQLPDERRGPGVRLDNETGRRRPKRIGTFGIARQNLANRGWLFSQSPPNCTCKASVLEVVVLNFETAQISERYSVFGGEEPRTLPVENLS